MTELNAAARLAIAALVGLAVGIEREWSVQKAGRPAHFAGLRTFAMLGIVGGCAGLLLASGYAGAAAALLAGATGLSVAAFVITFRSSTSQPDGTTEVAALLVVALGALAGLNMRGLAAGAGAIVVLGLSEKQALHAAVGRIGESELRAALRFSVLALVILPVLPAGPLLGPLELRPRALWTIVLLFSALNFAGFIARRAVGDRSGFALVGLLGGLLSSTAVTLEFSRRSRREPDLATPLALGVIGACTVLIPRVLIVSAVLNPCVALSSLPFLVPAFLCGGILFARWARSSGGAADARDAAPGNPLRLWMAIRMAIAFQIAMIAITFVRARWPLSGLYGTAAVLGLTDMDALTVGMNRPAEPLAAGLAARAIAVGMLANTAFKLAICGALGGPAYRRLAIGGLCVLALALGATLLLVG